LTDAAVVGRILRQYHQRAIRPADVRHLRGSVRGDQVAYRLNLAGGHPVVVRAVRADAAVGARFSGCGAATMLDWLAGRAATLAWLAGRGYPAPSVVRTWSGDLIGLAGPWLTLATTYVPGTALRPGPGQLRLLGEALGRLHSLSPAAAGAAGGHHRQAPGLGTPAGKSSWHPDAAIPATLARLDLVEALLPARWRPLHALFRQTVEAVRGQAGYLPEAVVHGGARPGKAILTGGGAAAAGAAGHGQAAGGAAGTGQAGGGAAGTGQAGGGAAGTGQAGVTLIDWDAGGLGLPVLDLGYCLLECHLGPDLPGDQPQEQRIQPDDERIAAIAEGYSSRRALGHRELGLLLDGIRFGTAFCGAIHFEQALIGGARGAAMDARLERLRARIAASEAVAERAGEHLARARSRYAEPGRPEAAGA
jgi:Ser/Thr protein kinase RdoA (MazF antagonist)